MKNGKLLKHQLFVLVPTLMTVASLSPSKEPVTQHHYGNMTWIPLCFVPHQQNHQLSSNCKNLYYY